MLNSSLPLSVSWMHLITLTSSAGHMSVTAIMATEVAVTRTLGQVAVTVATVTAEHRLGGWDKEMRDTTGSGALLVCIVFELDLLGMGI